MFIVAKTEKSAKLLLEEKYDLVYSQWIGKEKIWVFNYKYEFQEKYSSNQDFFITNKIFF